MNVIDTITDDANQLIYVQLEDGTLVQMTLAYRAATQRWSMDLVWNAFAVDGLGVEVSPNMVRQWRDLVPFGLACFSTDGGDPVYVDDFVNGRCFLYVLDAADVLGAEIGIASS